MSIVGAGNSVAQATSSQDVSVIVIQVESPNVIYVRKSPLPSNERDFLRALEDYCGRVHSKYSRWGSSLSERQLNVGHKYLALENASQDRGGGGAGGGRTQWRRGLLTNVLTVRGGHRACVYLIDEARSVDVPLNHLLPMPDEFGLQPPLLRKVVVAGIRPCSLVTDDLTCETNYGPTSTWDSAASQYAKTLFLHNSSLSDARLCRIRVNPETRLCFADLSFRVDDRKISSYAAHLKGLRFAMDDDAENSYALRASLESDKVGRHENSYPSPPFGSSSTLTLTDFAGNVIPCHKPGSMTNGSLQDRNNNRQPGSSLEIPLLEPSSPSTPTLRSLPLSSSMQITFQPASPSKNRSVQM